MIQFSNNQKTRVLVAMSGGVDSSAAAMLLKKKGFDVIGIFMIFQNNRKVVNDAQKSARIVAHKLKIPFYTVNFAKEFKRKVIDYFINEYKKGETPNPCVVCNKYIKSHLLLKKAKALGANYLATGHYVRKSKVPEGQAPKDKPRRTNLRGKPTGQAYGAGKSQKSKFIYKLFKAKDKTKDQSYFLYRLKQNQLAHLLFPLGDYTKIQVRNLARKFHLPVVDREESQGICFIKEKKHNEFLKQHIKIKDLKPGPIVDTKGNKLGKHKGLIFYTIGQREDIGLTYQKALYVVKKKSRTNTLVVTENPKDPRLYSKELKASNVNWISGRIPNLPLKIKAKIRYMHPAVPAVIRKTKNNWIYRVVFSKPQRAVTPGQSAVFYFRDEVLGGGIIK